MKAHLDKRLDPAHLPLRFAAPDAAADGGERRVTLEREQVVLARRVGRVAMRIAVPLTSYRGVAVRLVPGRTEDEDRVAVVLTHPDRALDVPLFEAEEEDIVVAEWKLWGNTLGLPLLVEHQDGGMMPADVREGGFQSTARVYPRRRYALLAGRRPRFLVRRKPGEPAESPIVYRDLHEITAPD
jgi:hypothetical protein